MNRPLLSIITINKNNITGLNNTLNSLIKQNNQDFQWIFVDGGSFDESLSVAKKFIRTGDILISETDTGIYNAMNKGIKYAEGSHIIFLNSGDALIDENSVELINNNLKKNYDIIMFGFLHKNKNRMPRQNWWRYWSMPTSHQAIIYRTNCFAEFRYNEIYKFAADFDHYLMLNKKKLLIKRVKKILILNDDYGTDKYIDIVLNEYNKVLISYGLPVIICEIIYAFKKLYLKNIIKNK